MKAASFVVCLALTWNTALAGESFGEDVARAMIRVAFNHPEAEFQLTRLPPDRCKSGFFWFYAPKAIDFGDQRAHLRFPFVVDIRTSAIWIPGSSGYELYNLPNRALARFRRLHRLSGEAGAKPTREMCPEASSEPLPKPGP